MQIVEIPRSVPSPATDKVTRNLSVNGEEFRFVCGKTVLLYTEKGVKTADVEKV
jgi:hypothetical protein